MERCLPVQQPDIIRLRHDGIKRAEGAKGKSEVGHPLPAVVTWLATPLIHSFAARLLVAQRSVTDHSFNRHADFPDPNCGAGWFLNSQYNMEQSISIAKDIDKFNQHEFNVYDQGRRIAVITHGRKKLDATDCGLKGKVWTRTDGFREIDTETGDTIFDWRTHDHVGLNESTYQSPCDEGNVKLGDFAPSRSWDAL